MPRKGRERFRNTTEPIISRWRRSENFDIPCKVNSRMIDLFVRGEKERYIQKTTISLVKKRRVKRQHLNGGVQKTHEGRIAEAEWTLFNFLIKIRKKHEVKGKITRRWKEAERVYFFWVVDRWEGRSSAGVASQSAKLYYSLLEKGFV